MKKFISIFAFAMLFLSISANAQQTWETWRLYSGDLSVLDASQSNTVYCQGGNLCFTEPSIDPTGGCSFVQFETDPPNAGSVVSSNGLTPECGGNYIRSFIPNGTTTDGEIMIRAKYTCNTIFGTTTEYRGLRVRYINMAAASTFTMAYNNLCRSPLTNITINRNLSTYLNGYKITLFDNFTNAQLYTTGYVSGNLTSYTLSSAQYNGFVGSKTYRVQLTAYPKNWDKCSSSNFSTTSQTFTIDNTPTVPSFNIVGNGKTGDFTNVYLCNDNTPITLNNTTTFPPCAPPTSVKFKYRQLYYGSITAGQMYGDPNGIPVGPFAPAASYNLRALISNMNTTNGWFSVDMEVTTALGTYTTLRQFIWVQKPPANPAVIADFGFSGSSFADGHAQYLCTTAADGEAYPLAGGTCATLPYDGWLSNGGTLANPTFVGASSMTMGGASISGVFGNMQSYKVQIWQKNPDILMGTYTGGTQFPANGLNINTEIPCSYPPAAPVNFFFSEKMREPGNGTLFNAKIFQAKLIVTDVCGKEYTSDDKKGFFKLIPNQPNWRNSGKSFEELDAQDINLTAATLLISPNPAQNQINIAFTSEEDGEGVLSIISVDGKTTQRIISINAGENTLKESVVDLPNGVYFVRLQQNERTLSQKFIKID
jgi:Secretion system C-terminal sorting domain